MTAAVGLRTGAVVSLAMTHSGYRVPGPGWALPGTGPRGSAPWRQRTRQPLPQAQNSRTPGAVGGVPARGLELQDFAACPALENLISTDGALLGSC